MANVWTGAFADAILIHPFDTKDGALIGPTAWTLKSGATIDPEHARFVQNLKCDTNGKLIDSDTAVTGFDGSDGKKVLYHFFWTADNLSFNRTMGGITNSAHGTTRTRILWDVAGARIIVRWTRKTDLGAGLAHLRVRSGGGLLTLGKSTSIVGFVDSGSASQGKVFIDGIDNTFDVANTAEVAALAGTLQHARIGNHTNGLDPGQFIDHFTMIQSASLTDAQVAILVPLYYNVRSFGYRPTIDSVGVDASDTSRIIISGTGFGPDAVVSLNSIIAPGAAVFGDTTISVGVPPGVSGATIQIQVTNVASNVTVTESTLSIPSNTAIRRNLWTENGLSTRLVVAGDNVTPEMNVIAGDPLPIFHPRIRPTVWTETAPLL